MCERSKRLWQLGAEITGSSCTAVRSTDSPSRSVIATTSRPQSGSGLGSSPCSGATWLTHRAHLVNPLVALTRGPAGPYVALRNRLKTRHPTPVRAAKDAALAPE